MVEWKKSANLLFICTTCCIPKKQLNILVQGRILKLEKIWFFGVKSWFFTRNTPTIFALPSARRNFFKCAPLTWNPVSAPEWNQLSQPIVLTGSVEAFNAAVSSIKYKSMEFVNNFNRFPVSCVTSDIILMLLKAVNNW